MLNPGSSADGSALGSGPRGPRFKSGLPEDFLPLDKKLIIAYILPVKNKKFCYAVVFGVLALEKNSYFFSGRGLTNK